MNLRPVKLFFCRLGVYLYLRLIYRRWSALYRHLHERSYRDYSLGTYPTFSAIIQELGAKAKWKADGWRQLWDAFSYPGRVQYLLDGTALGIKAEIGDCDEFAVWLANVIDQNFERGILERYAQTYAPIASDVLTVTWMKKDGSLGGHNVCLIEWLGPGGFETSYSYMDYGYPSTRVFSIRFVVEQVLRRYAGEGADCLGWSIHTKDLGLLETNWK